MILSRVAGGARTLVQRASSLQRVSAINRGPQTSIQQTTAIKRRVDIRFTSHISAVQASSTESTVAEPEEKVLTEDTSLLEEEHPLPSALTPIEIEDVWVEFSRRIEADEDITCDYLIIVARYVKLLDGPLALPRLQEVMREINKRNGDGSMDRGFIIGCNMLIHLYIVRRNLSSARMIYDKMTTISAKPDKITVSTMVNGIAKLGRSQDLHDFYTSMIKNESFATNPSIIKRFVIAFAERGDTESVQTYFNYMKKADSHDYLVVSNIVLGYYDQIGDYILAIKLLNEMKTRGAYPSEASYHHVLSVLYKSRKKEKMKAVFKDMLDSGIQPNSGHFSAMGWTPEDSLAEMKILNAPRKSRDYNTFIYTKVRENNFAAALDMFREMEKDGVSPDVYSYAIIIDTVVKDRTLPSEIALELFEEMKSRGVRPDVVAYTSMINVYARTSDMSNVLLLLEEMKNNHVHPTIYTFNSIFALLARQSYVSSEDINTGRTLWKQMMKQNITPDTRTYNFFLSLLFRKIEKRKPTTSPSPSLETFNDSGYYLKSMMDYYRQIKRIKRLRVAPDFITYTIMIHACIKCDNLKQALLVYNDSKAANVPLTLGGYNLLLTALETNKSMSQVMVIWHEMKKTNVLPDDTTYSIVLEACRELGFDDTFAAIRQQRKADMGRLMELESNTKLPTEEHLDYVNTPE
ncbi:hypothetical protein BDF14DRAFT_1755006 [Spinellus fusiger]|nr:hypothetical protein BDF14DRAFT_1755006 [Spinellus fusiger]